MTAAGLGAAVLLLLAAAQAAADERCAKVDRALVRLGAVPYRETVVFRPALETKTVMRIIVTRDMRFVLQPGDPRWFGGRGSHKELPLDKAFHCTALPGETLDGTEMDVVEARAEGGTVPLVERFWIARDTGLLRKTVTGDAATTGIVHTFSYSHVRPPRHYKSNEDPQTP